MKIFLINRADVQVFCNDKRLILRKEKGREYVETDQTDGEQVTVHFVRRHELSRPFWWLYALAFWILGVMGFFTPRYSAFLPQLDCCLTFIENKSAALTVRFAHYLDETGQRSIPAVTELTGFAVTENAYYRRDPVAKRRRKIYKICSWFGRIVLIAAIAAVTILTIIER